MAVFRSSVLMEDKTGTLKEMIEKKQKLDAMKQRIKKVNDKAMKDAEKESSKEK